MTLSDKIHSDEDNDLLWKEDVKEFIKEIKNIKCFGIREFMKELDKLAGDKLI